MSGFVRVQSASIKNSLRSRARSISASVSATVVVSGFSTSTALPACRQSEADAKWSLWVEAT